MALTKTQIFTIYVNLIDKSVLISRLLQLYNLLTAGQKTTVWNTIKNDLLAILNNNKTELVDSKNEAIVSADATIAAVDSQITDITSSTP